MSQPCHPAADWLSQMIVASLWLTPALFVLHLLIPRFIPWLAVWIPWLGAVHLTLCWFSGRILAGMLLALTGPGVH